MRKSNKETPLKKGRSPSIAKFAMLVLLLVSGSAFADGSGIRLPYEDGLDALMTSMEGPVPFAISLIGIVACGAMLIFGGEISGFMRTMIFIILVVAVIVQAGSLIGMLGGSKTGHARSGATHLSSVQAARNWT